MCCVRDVGGCELIRLNIITGFLGSGKTTFIRHLMSGKAFEGEKVIIIENEFGDVPIDGQILENENYSLVEISGGCICCSLKGDIIETLQELADEEKPDRILIEPSGIFNVKDLFEIMSNDHISSRYTLASIITLVDSDHFLIDKMRTAPFFAGQLQYATTVVISKLAQGTDEKADKVIEALSGYNQKADVYAVPISEIDTESLRDMCNRELWLGPDEWKETIRGGQSSEEGHGQLTSISIKDIKAFDSNGFERQMETMSEGAYGHIVRSKGYVTVEGERRLLQYVSGRYSLETAEEGSSMLIFIGENLDTRAIRRNFKKIKVSFDKVFKIKP